MFSVHVARVVAEVVLEVVRDVVLAKLFGKR
jgi:hypothetical protein